MYKYYFCRHIIDNYFNVIYVIWYFHGKVSLPATRKYILGGYNSCATNVILDLTQTEVVIYSLIHILDGNHVNVMLVTALLQIMRTIPIRIRHYLEKYRHLRRQNECIIFDKWQISSIVCV